ncbi:MAG: glutamine synthetase family protein [Ignavibacteria bacterium]
MTKYALTSPLSKILDKPKEDFTREDLLKVIEEKQIETIRFHYIALDGKLKELRIPLPDRKNAEIVLTEGERVDGSSLFKGLVDSGLSDLYVVPVYKTAFLNPFNSTSLDLVCRYVTANGELAPFTPDNILHKAANLFKKNTGIELHALGELEFYLMFNPINNMYFPPKQQGYHASGPYLKSGKILSDMLRIITHIAGQVKYAHSEVGFIEKIVSANPEIDGKMAEQLEIEFLSTPIEEAADDIVIAKWLIRNIAYQNGILATFAPKIEEGYAGSGMHFHLKLMKDGKSIMVDEKGDLTTHSNKLIGGLLHFADSLTAFGNTVPSSYLRLVPNMEAPTQFFWSDSNRKAMVRVPLGWSKISNLAELVNPGEKSVPMKIDSMQTIEFRVPDGSANVHQVLAGITMAAEYGFTQSEESLKLTEKLYFKGKTKEENTDTEFPSLPTTCADSADILEKKRGLYEREGVFPKSMIDYSIAQLRAENDREMHKTISELYGKGKIVEKKRIMHKDIHKH